MNNESDLSKFEISYKNAKADMNVFDLSKEELIEIARQMMIASNAETMSLSCDTSEPLGGGELEVFFVLDKKQKISYKVIGTIRLLWRYSNYIVERKYFSLYALSGIICYIVWPSIRNRLKQQSLKTFLQIV